MRVALLIGRDTRQPDLSHFEGLIRYEKGRLYLGQLGGETKFGGGKNSASRTSTYKTVNRQQLPKMSYPTPKKPNLFVPTAEDYPTIDFAFPMGLGQVTLCPHEHVFDFDVLTDCCTKINAFQFGDKPKAAIPFIWVTTPGKMGLLRHPRPFTRKGRVMKPEDVSAAEAGKAIKASERLKQFIVFLPLAPTWEQKRLEV